MPIHFTDSDVASQVAGVRSALIVPCQVCPAVTIAVREKAPFLSLFKHFLRSDPFEKYIKNLQSELHRTGVHADLFRNHFPHQWFLCMWTRGQCRRLRKRAGEYGAVIVLGCGSATLTVREAIQPDGTKPDGTKIVEGMAATGIMNAKLTFQFPGNIGFDESKIVPMARIREVPAGKYQGRP